MSTNVVMPQLGESVVEGTVGKWLKNVGDTIAQYEPIMEVITDKVTTEIPAPAAGTLTQILVPEGVTVKAGTVVAMIGQPNEITAPETPTADGGRQPEPISNLQSPSDALYRTNLQSPTNGSARNRFTPVVARMISEFSINDAELKSIQGTGESGRISKKDIETFLQHRTERAPQRSAPTVETLPPWEQPGTGELFRPTEEVFGKQSSTASPISAPTAKKDATRVPAPVAQDNQVAPDSSIVPLSPLRRAIAEHMVRSKTIAPHVTTVHEADMSRVLAHFAKQQPDFARLNVKLTYTPYFIQAVVHGLQHVPMVNAQFSEQGIIMKRDLNIGLAVAIDDGLIVPVIRNADDKSLLGLARAVNDLAARSRDKKLQPDEVSGGTFTITNYGVFGSLFGTPVISQPQSAILGIGAIQKRVVVMSDEKLGDVMAIRPMVYLALSFDHRLLDGAIGDTFMNKVKQFLENYPS